jgi:capsular exopolysaccharide synthesis family protein
MVIDTAAANDGQAGAALRRVGTERGLVLAQGRDWLVPDGDEWFRAIYTRAGTGVSEVLAVTSAIAGEGKSTISLGLAVTMAQDFPDRRVLLVETDLQTPTLASDFEIDPNPGLIDCLLEEQPMQVAYRPTALENLHLVPSGGPFKNSGRLLRSGLMANAVDAMRETHDFVVLDLAGVLANSDALPLTDLADGVIFVVRAGVTPTTVIDKAVALLDEAKLRGVVLNDTRSFVPRWLRRLCGM